MRVRTLFARSARAAAEYYGQYLAKDAHEIPGRWTGRQAPDLDLIGDVSVDDLSDVLAGLDPRTGQPLGRPLLDRITTNGKTIPAVGGFDATFSAPKSLSIWWGLTECHDIAVRAAASAIEQYGSTTRIRSNGSRMHLDTNGLTMAVFHQSTSRADDPQLHSHVIILLDVFVDIYNHQRPHRSLPHRATPATIYTTRPKARPGDTSHDAHYRVRHDRISKSGTITVRHNSRLHHIGIGKQLAGTYVVALIDDLHIRIIDATTGEVIHDLTLDTTRDYQPTGKPPRPPPKTKTPGPAQSRSGSFRSLARSQGRGDKI